MDIEGKYYCSRCMRELPAEETCPSCGYDSSERRRDSTALEDGTLLNRRYLLGAAIGSGGFGITYAAWDEVLRIPVAVKEYYPRDFVSRDVREADEVCLLEAHREAYIVGLRRFLRESQILAMFQDVKGIVKVYDCFEENQTAYIIMEYVRGKPLDAYVKDEQPQPQELLRMMRQPVDALIAVHRQGILHRDITPRNLLVQEDGTIKLIDFGSALEVSRRAGTILLTDKYSPIEQYDIGSPQGPWTDVYGLCATLYALLTGEPPPESIRRERHDELKPLSEKHVRLRRHEENAIMRGLVVMPEKRVQSMEEFRAMLYNLPMPQEVKRRRRMVRRMCVAAACLVVLAAGLALNFAVGFPLGDGLLYSLHSDGFHVSGVCGALEDLVIPASKLGMPVAAIRGGALTEQDGLKTVEIPGSVREIGEMAFRGCDGLTLVSVGEGLRRIDAFAFADCPSLHSVYLPASVESIDPGAFVNAWERVTLWGSHGSFAEGFAQQQGLAFSGSGDYAYAPVAGGAAITRYLGDQTQITMPSYVDGLPVVAFLTDEADGQVETVVPEGVREVVLPLHLKRLPNNVFGKDKALVSVTLGGELEELGRGALDFTGIQALTLPEGLTSIGDMALAGTPIETIAFPDSLERIGESAFSSGALQAVAFPSSLREIGAYAFSGNGFAELALPDSVSYVGNNAFLGCRSLEKVAWSASAAEIHSGTFAGCESLRDVTIPAGVTIIEEGAFDSCASLENVVLPETIETIENMAFARCDSLRAIYLPPSVSSIHDFAFDDRRPPLLIIGVGGSYAEAYAFRRGFRFEDCVAREAANGGSTLALPTVARGEFVTAVERADVQGRAFTRVQMPTMLKTIGAECFAENRAVEEVVMENVEEIGAKAFAHCEGLRAISFPDGMKRIGSDAFVGCQSLREALLPHSLEQLDTGAFLDCVHLEKLRIPVSLRAIEPHAFAGTGLTEVDIPGNILSCGYRAFGDCRMLKSVTVGEGLSKIEGGSFLGDTALETVSLPSTLRTLGLGGDPFEGCVSLRDVWIYAMKTEFYVETYADTVSDRVFQNAPDVTLHAYPGSDAEAYAVRYGMRFEPIVD